MPSKKARFVEQFFNRKALPVFFAVLGFAVFLSGGYLYFSGRTKPAPSVSGKTEEQASLHSKPNAVRLIIAGVKIDLPVTEGKIVDGVWETTQEGVSHLDISANPGENGNIVIYGHNKKVLLGSLPYVPMGATVKVETEDGKEYVYKVYEKKNVEATDISIAYATPSEVLTIYTCDGPIDGPRFVLFAKPI
ncbi:MAG: Sortase family protein [Candidatus Woesebacteria bacterium GW2011_GWB1_45_5]|uniref:Sortase family protein n=1 Tax=Candidatus Woesebacteria bacterium GW2011_GWB1_45_5 TaxID=1618581 RepID=A0A0G1MQ85_9BACT|nr:MAG: Sortase family protein [Candidatus Woesebacteria bacterium GW2011_GWB1_45_5]